MLDPQLLRTDPDAVAARLADRGYDFDADAWRDMDARRKELQVRTQELQNRKNQSAKSIGEAKRRGEDIQPLLDEVKSLGDELGQVEAEFATIRDEQQALMMGMPNLQLDDVPAGRDETDNVEVLKWGEPTAFEFEPRDHIELGELSGQLDAASAAKLAGSRFTVLKGGLSRLHRALAQYMLDVHTQEHGYTELYLPYLVNAQAMTGTGQLPKFGDDAFATTDEQPRYLIPTAEVPMTNMVADEIIDADELPLRFTAHTPCFRREAGSYGQDTRGMIRQHQFEKVELVQVTRPGNSSAALEELTGHAEVILQRLELPYRKIVLCTGDMGFSAAKTYDLEVWLPGQGAYREISSCSVCTDFQARRANIRFKPKEGGKSQFVHTLNGSALAVGRTVVAILENNQEPDGRVRIPEVLQPMVKAEYL